MSIPSCAIEIIKQFEGCSLTAYPDPLTGNKPVTIGWGSTKKRDGSNWKLGDRITQEEADNLLIYQLEKNYLPKLEKIPHWHEFNENQQGAIISFAWNLGADFYGSENFDTITYILKTRKYDRLPLAFTLYCNPGSSCYEGLKRRRLAEGELFTKPVAVVAKKK